MSRNGAIARVNSVQAWFGQIASNNSTIPAATAAIFAKRFVFTGANSVFGSTASTSTTAESTTASMSSSDPLIESGSSLESSSTAVEIRSCNSGCRISSIRAMWVRVSFRERGRTRNHQAATSVIASPVRLRAQRTVEENRVIVASIAMITSRQVSATASVANRPRTKSSLRTRRIIASSLFRIGGGSWLRAASKLLMILFLLDQSTASAQHPFRC